MKKTLMLILVIIASLILTYGFSYAKVGGPCNSCHTMHNSQDGTAMNYNGDPNPNPYLLRGDCLGCHAQHTASNIVNTIPQVYHTNAQDLAGGNFDYVNTSDTYGHNIVGLFAGNIDNVLTNYPPGYNTNYDPSSAGFGMTTQVRCAGAYGCHGNRDNTDQDASIFGGHHFDDSILKFGGIVDGSQGQYVGNSYRFLYRVRGGENTSWLNIANNNHNEYRGAAYAVRSSQNYTWGDGDCVTTISDLCGECHGMYHLSGSGGIGTGSPWLRHPTDAVIPNTGEYNTITTAGGYNEDTPVGRQTVPNAISQNVALNSDVVVCLSCHGAHGTPYQDLLKWNYINTSGGMPQGTGCTYCHTGKDGY